MPHFKLAVIAVAPFAMAFVLLTQSCDGRNKTTSPKTESTPTTLVTVEKERSTEINIEGAGLRLPAESTLEGYELGVSVSSTPADFNDTDSDPVGSAIRVGMTNQDGEPVDEIPVPMAISLSTGENLGLVQDAGGLCVFLKTRRGELYIWREDALSVEGRIVTFETLRLGTFQLRRCRPGAGDRGRLEKFEKLPAKKIKKIVVEKKRGPGSTAPARPKDEGVLAKISIPVDSFPLYGEFSHFCAGFAVVDDGERWLSESPRRIVRVEHTAGLPQTLLLPPIAGVDFSSVAEGQNVLVILILVDDPEPDCEAVDYDGAGMAWEFTPEAFAGLDLGNLALGSAELPFRAFVANFADEDPVGVGFSSEEAADWFYPPTSTHFQGCLEVVEVVDVGQSRGHSFFGGRIPTSGSLALYVAAAAGRLDFNVELAVHRSRCLLPPDSGTLPHLFAESRTPPYTVYAEGAFLGDPLTYSYKSVRHMVQNADEPLGNDSFACLEYHFNDSGKHGVGRLLFPTPNREREFAEHYLSFFPLGASLIDLLVFEYDGNTASGICGSDEEVDARIKIGHGADEIRPF